MLSSDYDNESGYNGPRGQDFRDSESSKEYRDTTTKGDILSKLKLRTFVRRWRRLRTDLSLHQTLGTNIKSQVNSSERMVLGVTATPTVSGLQCGQRALLLLCTSEVEGS
jgi:hypothetical protein